MDFSAVCSSGDINAFKKIVENFSLTAQKWDDKVLYAFYRSHDKREWQLIANLLGWAVSFGQAMVEFKIIQELMNKDPGTRQALDKKAEESYPDISAVQIKAFIDIVLQKKTVMPLVFTEDNLPEDFFDKLEDAMFAVVKNFLSH